MKVGSSRKQQEKGSKHFGGSKYDKKDENQRGTTIDSLGTRQDVQRLLRRLDLLREECDRMPLKKHNEVNVYFEKLAECLRE